MLPLTANTLHLTKHCITTQLTLSLLPCSWVCLVSVICDTTPSATVTAACLRLRCLLWGHSPTQKALKHFFILMLFKSLSESPLGGYQLGHGRAARLQNGVWFLRVFWLRESSETTQVQHPAYVPVSVAFQQGWDNRLR